MPAPQRTFEPCLVDGHLTDICLRQQGRSLTMLGSGGAAREWAVVDTFLQSPTCALPVLLGSGLGHALRRLLHEYAGPLAVVDKEVDLLEMTRVRESLSVADQERVLWVQSSTPEEALRQLTQWQLQQWKKRQAHGAHDLPTPPCLHALLHPFYARLHREYYSLLREKLSQSTKANFWEQAIRPRFSTATPRLLLITSKYFLMGELIGACDALRVPYKLLTIDNDEMASTAFVEQLLKAAVEFQPDALLTLNHLGVDREGVLMDLLHTLQLPLASWFVDNPHLILHLYQTLVSPWASIFTWDVDNINSLKAMGFEHVFYLPLATDPQRFALRPSSQSPTRWRARVSFVGNSMLYKVGARLKKGRLSRPLLTSFKQTATRFGQSEERSVRAFLQGLPDRGALLDAYAALPDNESRLTYETALTWEATRQYRTQCVEQLLPFHPLIVGDPGWRIVFKKQPTQVRLHGELGYYDELPLFYPCSEINFNCTSKQMKGAVNQRIFDVPATGGFVLTDWREQMDNLFEPHTEIAYYEEAEQVPELIQYYLDHPQERTRIAQAARRRILAEHTWQHRLQTLLEHLRAVYGTPLAKAAPNSAGSLS